MAAAAIATAAAAIATVAAAVVAGVAVVATAEEEEEEVAAVMATAAVASIVESKLGHVKPAPSCMCYVPMYIQSDAILLNFLPQINVHIPSQNVHNDYFK